MTKRADKKFTAKALDAYDTISEDPVIALLPHLKFGEPFIEPCAGKGDLIKSLEKYGHKCIWASDIAPRAEGIFECDLLNLSPSASNNGRYVTITNPMWNMKFLHPQIEHLRTIGDAWILNKSDWMHNVDALPYLPFVEKTVSIGRVNWIEGTKHKGFENVSWYLFKTTPCKTPGLHFGNTGSKYRKQWAKEHLESRACTKLEKL